MTFELRLKTNHNHRTLHYFTSLCTAAWTFFEQILYRLANLLVHTVNFFPDIFLFPMSSLLLASVATANV